MAATIITTRQPLWSRAFLQPDVLVRNLTEMIGTLGFVTALALTPLSSATAILQSAPLVVTLGAALFLREPVGWRRWVAITVGFIGVLMVIRPGSDTFDPRVLFAVLGTLGLAVRDLATRRIPRETSSVQLSFFAFLSLVPTAPIFGAWMGMPAVAPDPRLWLLIGAPSSSAPSAITRSPRHARW